MCQSIVLRDLSVEWKKAVSEPESYLQPGPGQQWNARIFSYD